MKPKLPDRHPRTSRNAANQQILEEACGWFVDFRAGDIDAAAREEFRRWLARSPEHIQAYMEIASTYAEIPAPGADGKVDVEALLAHARSAPDTNVVPLTRGEESASMSTPQVTATAVGLANARPARTKLAHAAVLVLAIASLSTWYYVQRGTYATDIGEQRSIVLEDGSTVELNSSSGIRVRYTQRARHIDLLYGQALFEVAKDVGRPFVVQTDKTRVRAIGTQFDVYRKQSGGTVVSVIEGRVAIEAALTPAIERARTGEVQTKPASATHEAEVLLAAGEQLIVKPKSVEKPPHADIASATAWTSRQLIFDGTPLTEVAEEFNRYSTRRLVIDGAGAADFHVSGTYSSTNPESLLRFLRTQPALKLIESEREIRVTSQ
jgi:transmembrane sensor